MGTRKIAGIVKENFIPSLSVVMVTPERYETCRPAISFLRKQTVRELLELVIVAPARAALELVEPEMDAFGDFQIVEIGKIVSTGRAMAEGFRAARAPLVAYSEEHTYPEPEWAEAMVHAHAGPYAAVGAVIGNANPRSLVSWAHLYGQFGPAVAPAQSRKAKMLAAHHVSYKRQVVLQYGDMLGRMLEDECALFLDLRSRGQTLYLSGDAVSNHLNITRIAGYCLLDFIGQRGFASARAQAGGWSTARRVFYAAATPLVPFLRMRRSVRDIFRTGRARQLLPQIVAPMAAALLCGMAGEMLGYLTEPSKQNSEDRTEFELNREAFVSDSDRAAIASGSK